MTKSVRQLVFDGYRDPLLDFAQHLPPGTFPPLEKFGWFYEVRTRFCVTKSVCVHVVVSGNTGNESDDFFSSAMIRPSSTAFSTCSPGATTSRKWARWTCGTRLVRRLSTNPTVARLTVRLVKLGRLVAIPPTSPCSYLIFAGLCNANFPSSDEFDPEHCFH